MKPATVDEALEGAASTPYGLTFLDAQEQAQSLGWKEILERAGRAAAVLGERGVRAGDRVALVLPTSPLFVDAFFGALLAGAVPVPLYPPVRLGRLDEYHRSTARMMGRVGAVLAIGDSRTKLLLGPAVGSARPELGLLTAEELSRPGAPRRWRAASPEDLALIQFSSGSTVDPKPVALSQGNLIAQCAALRALMPESAAQGARGVSWLPLYHDMGLIGALLSAAYYPGPLVLIGPEVFLSRPAIWLRAISRYRATISPGPNFAYALCLKRVSDSELEGVDLSSWRYALCGAEMVSAQVMRRFAARFSSHGFDPASLMPVYGLSEASLAVSFTRRSQELRTVEIDSSHLARTGEVTAGDYPLVSVGRPVPGVEVEVRDEQGAPLAEGRVGRIFARGPSVMRGYFADPAGTAEAVREGWLDTGDLGFWSGGELYISGRSRDLVIIRGANHAPQEFEACLEGIEGLRPGCAVAVGFCAGPLGSEELLVLAERGKPEREEAAVVAAVTRAVVERTGIRPHTVRLLHPGTLPRTSSGKLRRAEALRRHLAGELHPPKAMNAVRLAAEVAKSTLALAKSRFDRLRAGR